MGGLLARGAQAEGHWRERGGWVGENIKGVGGDRACLWQIPVFWSLRVERGVGGYVFFLFPFFYFVSLLLLWGL